ncbi:4Fe-4S single cluster domain-containing protein [Saccharicrinis carchari]|uniref:4Fe-4S single cluster domain-containing protein n=1 Tax=Saccharicrinis carchari TaxID=1168039 RepID=A0A521ESP2_SACCC|nr:radical SAM protein [Saccharicrinis carchari]SMO86963.1 4Fe-4S single cluster domain-containing protein [Saccharicrinis carchari]
MSTFLFDKIIFGPVKSRRLGVSLGVNLLPVNKKICTYDCIYCECGFNGDHAAAIPQMPKREEVKYELEKVLKDMQRKGKAPNVITFAGNGEPTIHKDFAAIIEDTIALRNSYSPQARIAVLSNATMTHKPSVFEALKKVDDNILKLDSGLEETIRLLDKPQSAFTLSGLVDNLRKFDGQLIIQTMFVQGHYNGREVDNTTNENVDPWLNLLKDIRPKSVMIYTIERDTPVEGLIKVPLQVLKQIARKVEELGIPTQVSG